MNITILPKYLLYFNIQTFTLDDIIEKIQKIVKQKNIRIAEFMRDFDKLRSGTITNTQFLSCLSMLKIFLTHKESEMLIEKYKCNYKDTFVMWKGFCDDIDQVFIIKNLENEKIRNRSWNVWRFGFR